MVKFDIDLLTLCHHKMIDRVKYKWDSKPSLGLESWQVKTADCSGYIRYLLYRASNRQLVTPEGSVEIHELFSGLLTPCEFVATKNIDGIVRVSFIPETKDHAGHIWLTLNGHTIECYGGHGAGSRQWNTPILKNEVIATFILQ